MILTETKFADSVVRFVGGASTCSGTQWQDKGQEFDSKLFFSLNWPVTKTNSKTKIIWFLVFCHWLIQEKGQLTKTLFKELVQFLFKKIKFVLILMKIKYEPRLEHKLKRVFSWHQFSLKFLEESQLGFWSIKKIRCLYLTKYSGEGCKLRKYWPFLFFKQFFNVWITFKKP